MSRDTPPPLSKPLQAALAAAYQRSKAERHEFITLEHLLLGLLEDAQAREAVTACGGDPVRLASNLEGFIAEKLDSLPGDEPLEPAPTLGFHRVMEYAILHGMSSEQTNSAAQTINRIVDIFPAHQQGQIRVQLSFVLEGILCQSLLPRATGKGRALAMEILVPNAAIRNLIREDKVHQIYGMMQTGQAKYGMQTFNQALAALYFKRMISLQTALNRSSYPEELQEIISRGPTAMNQNMIEGPGAPVAQRS